MDSGRDVNRYRVGSGVGWIGRSADRCPDAIGRDAPDPFLTNLPGDFMRYLEAGCELPRAESS